MLRIPSRFSSLHQEMQFCLLKDSEAGKLVVVEQVLSWKWGWPVAGLGAGKWLLEWLQGVWRVASEIAGLAVRTAKGRELTIARVWKRWWWKSLWVLSRTSGMRTDTELCHWLPLRVRKSAVVTPWCSDQLSYYMPAHIIADLTLDLWAAEESQLLESVLSQFYWTLFPFFFFPPPPDHLQHYAVLTETCLCRKMVLLEQMQQPLLLTMFCEVLCTAHKEWSIPCRVESQPGPGYLCPAG